MPVDSSRPASAGKRLPEPKKPSPDFPLGIHKGTRYWCKKVRGKAHYFGKWDDDPQGIAALDEWLRVKDYLKQGKPYPPHPNDENAEEPEGVTTVALLCGKFMTDKEKNGGLSPRTLQELDATCQRVVRVFGKRTVAAELLPEDFGRLRNELAKTRGAVALRNEIQRVRQIFQWGYKRQRLLAVAPHYGSSFDKPRAQEVRRERQAHREEHGDRMLEAEDVRLILDHLSGIDLELSALDEDGNPVKVRGKRNPALRAMVLLGANCAFGQSDLASLPFRALDLDSGWIDFPRVKTMVPRMIPLWPETVEAIREYLTGRPQPKDTADSRLVFITKRGGRWVKTGKNGGPIDAIGQEFTKVLERLHLKRDRIGFYALRHSFATIASESLDPLAVAAVMGHVPGSKDMGAHYRERIGKDRLQRVTDHVRQWVFGKEGE